MKTAFLKDFRTEHGANMTFQHIRFMQYKSISYKHGYTYICKNLICNRLIKKSVQVQRKRSSCYSSYKNFTSVFYRLRIRKKRKRILTFINKCEESVFQVVQKSWIFNKIFYHCYAF